MKIIFWNINKKDLISEIFDLAMTELPDILVLCECKIDASELLLKLNSDKVLYYFIPVKATNIKVFTLFSDTFIKPLEDSGRYSILKISLPLKSDFLFVPLHIPDKGSWLESSQKLECVSISTSVMNIEETSGIKETIIVGDFNMNPFEEGMISSMGFHATRDKTTAFKKARKVQGRSYKFFYNPTWKFYRQIDARPQGTYFYWSSEHICNFWNLFDQIIFRPELITKFDDDSFVIISRFKQHNLIRGNGMISEAYSDHLPIRAEFHI